MDAEPEWEWWVIWHVGHDDFSIDAVTQWVQILRSWTPEGTLKPIDTEALRDIIHEFYVVVMQGEFVGCFRVFQPDSLKEYRALELGSVVSAKRWVGWYIAEQAETISIEQKLPIVAITRWRFANILKRRWWKIRKRKYRERRNESCKTKVLLEFKP
jgi:hypothetical protein